MNDNQLTVSYELLYLMQWLFEHESENIKKIITSALEKGLHKELKTTLPSSLETKDMTDLQNSIVDFLALLETLLQEAVNEKNLKHLMEKQLMPALDHIDNHACDQATVDFSVEKTTYRLEQNPKGNAQEILFKELLKCWKPNKKTASH